MSQTPEQRLDKEIMLWCGQHNWLCFHQNVGKIKFYDETQQKDRFFSTGFPEGWPDLLILTEKGQAIFCETKIKPRKPTQAQLNTLEILKKRGFLAFVAYSIDEFTSSVENVLKSENKA